MPVSAMSYTPPILPPPPRPIPATPEWSPEWVNWATQVNRWLEGLSQQQAGFVYVRLAGIYFPDPPLTGYGLRAGEVFSNAGVLTVVREGDIWMGPLTVATGLGELTVVV